MDMLVEYQNKNIEKIFGSKTGQKKNQWMTMYNVNRNNMKTWKEKLKRQEMKGLI